MEVVLLVPLIGLKHRQHGQPGKHGRNRFLAAAAAGVGATGEGAQNEWR